MTHSNSRMTVLDRNIESVPRIRSAMLACLGSSSARSRTRRLVSTARMPPPDLFLDRGVHLFDRMGSPFVLQHSAQVRNGELLLIDRLEQHAVGPIFDVQARPGLPAPLVTDRLRQNDLTLRGDLGLHHGCI